MKLKIQELILLATRSQTPENEDNDPEEDICEPNRKFQPTEHTRWL